MEIADYWFSLILCHTGSVVWDIGNNKEPIHTKGVCLRTSRETESEPVIAKIKKYFRGIFQTF